VALVTPVVDIPGGNDSFSRPADGVAVGVDPDAVVPSAVVLPSVVGRGDGVPAVVSE
jgi:hypothetical protein